MNHQSCFYLSLAHSGHTHIIVFQTAAITNFALAAKILPVRKINPKNQTNKNTQLYGGREMGERRVRA